MGSLREWAGYLASDLTRVATICGLLILVEIALMVEVLVAVAFLF